MNNVIRMREIRKLPMAVLGGAFRSFPKYGYGRSGSLDLIEVLCV